MAGMNLSSAVFQKFDSLSFVSAKEPMPDPVVLLLLLLLLVLLSLLPPPAPSTVMVHLSSSMSVKE